MIELQNLTLNVADKTLLDSASCRLEDHWRVGLIGRNGCGKSTLLKLLLGELAETTGNAVCTTNKTRIGYLAQSLPATQQTALEFAKTGDDRWLRLQQQLKQAELANDGNAIAHCHLKLDEIDAYTLESRAEKILLGLGFSQEQFQWPVNQFSGGWQMRLQLAKVLLSGAELLLLDEPTNHLDINAIIWLGNWLKQLPTSQLIISHDREFLDQVCTHILHLNSQSLTVYKGNYSSFSKQYQQAQLLAEKTNKKMEAKRAHLESFISRFRAKASKAKQAQSRIKALEKLNFSQNIVEENTYQLNFSSDASISGPIIDIEGKIGHGDKVLLNVDGFSLYHGDRIAILGKNGSGKTTLLNTLSGKLPLISGKIVSHNKLKIGYYSQEQAESFPENSTPLSIFTQRFPDITSSTARGFLGSLGFSGKRVEEPIDIFSGGERSRLALGILSYEKPHLLILDEPTNHLDLEMKESLILSLLDFSGAIILVSHDRHFISSVVNQTLYINKKQLHPLEDNDFVSYEKFILDQSKDKPKETKKEKPNPPKKIKNENKSKNIEKNIENLLKKKKSLEIEIAENSKSTNFHLNKDYLNLTKQYEKVKIEIEQLEEAWLFENETHL